ncbi:DUF2254 domain-containing protein [Alkalihalobacterium chitinilyticum]|uniref:DUF2254 domain-containing protein n=1 Tax=Alkalihalobacterium chitinilyticum TaxID=2980103 RepID=A0ABT5VDR4_9BACI|nr:DUF2254 domain-containing protein [Alkalihalobacterium chitinilyticum]MDE5413603.1 DUF2254 domain-containing protein [Alkalihalobacterium chitinilyticum]
MMSRLQTRLLQLRSSFLFLPSFYSLIAIALAVLFVQIDYYIFYSTRLGAILPSVFFTDLALAQTLLGAISASLLTMTTISFSTIMVVLTTYLSQFSPRTLQNFVNDHHTQRILGVFISGFIFSIVTLLLLRERDGVSLFFSPTVAVIYAIICVGFFVFFIHHVSLWIQVSNLIHQISRNTVDAIQKNYHNKENSYHDAPWDDWESAEIKRTEPLFVHVEKPGYLQLIELEALIEQAKQDDVIIEMKFQLGDYVDTFTPFLHIWPLAKNIDSNSYLPYFLIGHERVTVQDIDFGLTKLVEICLKALSPGINDPNTAVSCINELGKVLTVLGQKNVERAFYNDDKRALRLMLKQKHFRDYLYHSFYQIRHYANDDVSVISAIIEALIVIASHNDREVKQEIHSFSEYIIEGMNGMKFLSLDEHYLHQKLEKLAIHTKPKDDPHHNF